MVERVVVGFDGSQGASVALAWAAGEARLHGAGLVALTVLSEQPREPVSEEVLNPVDELGPVRRTVEEITHGAAVFRYDIGDAVAELTSACTDADLLVVGSRGRSRFSGLLLGSASRGCLYHAPCPVAVVRPGTPTGPPPRRVVVGIDASDAARLALRVAAEEARLRGAALHAIHAVHWDRLGVELVAPAAAQLVAWGRQLVADELAHSGVAARPVVIHGHAADVLVRHSRHAELLVLGSRGRSPLAGTLLGSTSDHCAQHAMCPVIVVHPTHALAHPATTGGRP
jgi:nucleotide-binding universal stress UspA family protein